MLRAIFVALTLAFPAQSQEHRPFASFVGASEALLNDPHDLTFGPDGKLYIADKFAHRVVIMDPDTLDIIGSIGDGDLNAAHDVSFGPDGQLYVAVSGYSAVAVYSMTDGVLTNQGAVAPFAGTEGVLAHSNGKLYVMASGTGRLYAVVGDQIQALATGMPGAHDVAEAPDGTIWVADNFQRRLVRFTPDLEQIQVLDGPQYGFVGPRYMDIDPDGVLYVADQDAHRVLKIDPQDNTVLGVIGTGQPGIGPGILDDPEGVAVRGTEFFFADSDNNRIVKYVVVLN